MARFFSLAFNSEAPGKATSYFLSFLVVAAATIPGFLLRQALDSATICLFYLLGVVGISVWLGRGPAIMACFASVLALDYFVIPPYYSLAINHSESWMTLLVMLVVSLVISTLAAKSREGERHRVAAETEKNRSALLSAVSHDLRTPLTAIEGAASS